MNTDCGKARLHERARWGRYLQKNYPADRLAGMGSGELCDPQNTTRPLLARAVNSQRARHEHKQRVRPRIHESGAARDMRMAATGAARVDTNWWEPAVSMMNCDHCNIRIETEPDDSGTAAGIMGRIAISDVSSCDIRIGRKSR